MSNIVVMIKKGPIDAAALPSMEDVYFNLAQFRQLASQPPATSQTKQRPDIAPAFMNAI